MIAESFLALFIVFVAFFYYRFYYHPKKMLNHYVKVMRDLGYKVYQYDFAFMGYPPIKIGLSDKRDKKDGWWTSKNVLAGYDVAVGNAFQNPLITFLSPKLIKDTVGIDKLKIFPKITFGLQLLQCMLVDGLVFA